MSIITTPIRRMVTVAAAAAATVAIAPGVASAAPPTAEQLTDHLRFLAGQRLEAMRPDFEARRDGRAVNGSSLAPGDVTDVRVVDLTDPAGFLTKKGRRKINVADSGLSSLVGLDISMSWVAQDDGGRTLPRTKATSFGATTLPFTAFKFEPRLISDSVDPSRFALNRNIRARLQLTVDLPPVSALVEPLGGDIDRLDLPIDLTGASQEQIAELKKVDVGPVSRTVELNLPVPVEALPVPNVLLAFRHTDYSLKVNGKPGFLLVMAPGLAGAPVDANEALQKVQDSVNDLRQKANSLVGLAGFLGENLVDAVRPIKQQIDLYRDKARFGVRVVAASSQGNLNRLTMIQNNAFTNDIEAEDEISALMTLGLPGSGWRLYADRGFKGVSLDIEAGSRFFTEAPNLHSSSPAGTTRRTKVRKSWGDSFSSLELARPVSSL